MLFRNFIIVSLCWTCLGCDRTDNTQRAVQTTTADTENHRFDCKTIEVEGGWGYVLYVDGGMVVKQEHIPAINGLFPFQSESDAWQVGSLALDKMEQGISPPTITIEEMVNLGIQLPPQN